MTKFGTFKGVFVPSTEAILGTVLFLILPLLVGDIGLVAMSAVIILAHSVTFATAFSLADCATNLNNIGGGGMYALAKRSLGKAFGGSIGIQLYFAQAASIGFYCIGFAEPLQALLAPFLQAMPFFSENATVDILLQKQLIASAVYILFFIFAIIGADFTLKIQIMIFVVLFASIATIFLSPFTGIRYNNIPLFSGLQTINLFGKRETTLALFFVAFAQFFPAVTGIDAGVGMSGDLKNPKKSLVRGTFLAICITFCVYCLSTFVFSLMNPNLLVTAYSGKDATGNLLTDLLGLGSQFPFNVMGMLVLAGILFATSSSALSCFMTAPRTLQSLCRDDVLPTALRFFSNDFRKGGNEPRFATLLTFFIGISVIWMGSINLAASIVGILFLVVYGWVNGSAFLERISGNPTFRPTSKGHWALSFYGFAASIGAILLFSWKIGLAIIVVQFVIFQLLLKYKAKGRLEGVWWGVLFSLINRSFRSLAKIVMGTKNWRPILTAIGFSGKDNCSDAVAYLASIIAAHKGIVSLHLVVGENEGESAVLKDKVRELHHFPVNYVHSDDYTQSVLSLIQFPLMGFIDVNTVLLEYTKSIDTVRVLGKVLALNKNVILLKGGDRIVKNERIDIWWRGEQNGNFMVMLGYIMNASLKANENRMYQVRIIRKLNRGEDKLQTAQELQDLLEKGRVDGEVVILEDDAAPFSQVLYETSKDADLVMMGLPGNYVEQEKKRFFNLDKFFFDKEIGKYKQMPAILFIKCAQAMSLIEE